MSRKKTLTVTAPGKMMLAGEYAVLYGHSALVCAVDRRVKAFCDRPHKSPGRLLSLVVEETRQLGKRININVGEFIPDVESDQLFLNGRKLGLGSSAAVAVACTAAVMARAGVDPAELKEEIRKAAFRAHKKAQGGSGADIAASTLGGVLEYAIPGGADPSITRIEWPEELKTVFVWTGSSAVTHDLILRVDKVKTSDPAAHEEIMKRIGHASSNMIRAIKDSNIKNVLSAVTEQHAAFRDLGIMAGVEIVTKDIEDIAAMARDSGGSAKQSGAGGGDMAVAFFDSRDALADFSKSVHEKGYECLDMCIDKAGVRIERV